MSQTTKDTAFVENPVTLLRQFRSKIHFRLFDNQTDVTNKKLHFNNAEIFYDVVNTVIDGESPLNTDRFLADMLRMSTIATGYLINAMVSRMKPSHAYLNIGVWRGFTFFAGLANNPLKTCIGVDNFSQYGGPRDDFLAGYERYKSANSAFHDMDYEVYFASKHAGPLGLYYYDGKHDYADQLRALELAEPYFAPDTLILVDDTNGEGVRRATLDFVAARPGRYQVLLDERTFGNAHPTFWNGLMVIGPAGTTA